jgi:hypothetical protein
LRPSREAKVASPARSANRFDLSVEVAALPRRDLRGEHVDESTATVPASE